MSTAYEEILFTFCQKTPRTAVYKTNFKERVSTKKPTPENKLSVEFGYSELSHHNVRRMILESLKGLDEGKQSRMIDSRCKRMALILSGKPRKRAKVNAYTLVFEVMEQAAVIAVIIQGDEGLLDNKFYNFRTSQDSTKNSTTTESSFPLTQRR